MGTEYRLVTERPAHQDGRAQQVYLKRDYDHARQSLEDWARDMERYRRSDLELWHAKIQEREVTDWVDVFDDTEGIPI